MKIQSHKAWETTHEPQEESKEGPKGPAQEPQELGESVPLWLRGTNSSSSWELGKVSVRTLKCKHCLGKVEKSTKT